MGQAKSIHEKLLDEITYLNYCTVGTGGYLYSIRPDLATVDGWTIIIVLDTNYDQAIVLRLSTASMRSLFKNFQENKGVLLCEQDLTIAFDENEPDIIVIKNCPFYKGPTLYYWSGKRPCASQGPFVQDMRLNKRIFENVYRDFGEFKKIVEKINGLKLQPVTDILGHWNVKKSDKRINKLLFYRDRYYQLIKQ